MDDARFEAAWSAFSQELTRYCTFSTGSAQDGEEIAAEAFSRLLSTRRPIRPDKTEAWLFTVAHNLCMSRHRASGRERSVVARLSAAPPSNPPDAWIDTELWESVRGLDERSRLAIYIRVLEDRPFADVARIMCVSEGAAKMTYYRAMERLRVLVGASEPQHAEPYAGGVTDAE